MELLAGFRTALQTGPGNIEASLAAVEGEPQLVAAGGVDEPIEANARRFEVMKA